MTNDVLANTLILFVLTCFTLVFFGAFAWLFGWLAKKTEDKLKCSQRQNRELLKALPPHKSQKQSGFILPDLALGTWVVFIIVAVIGCFRIRRQNASPAEIEFFIVAIAAIFCVAASITFIYWSLRPYGVMG